MRLVLLLILFASSVSVYAEVWGINATFRDVAEPQKLFYFTGQFTERDGEIGETDIGELVGAHYVTIWGVCPEGYPSCFRAMVITPTHLSFLFGQSPSSVRHLDLALTAPLSQGGTIQLVPGVAPDPDLPPWLAPTIGSEYRYYYGIMRAELISGSITAGVPEPSTYVVLGAGLILAGLHMRRARPSAPRKI